MITEEMINRQQEKEQFDPTDPIVYESACKPDNYPHSGFVQLLFPLTLMNRRCYAYPKDCYGSRSPNNYGNRDNYIDFAQGLKPDSYANEVMVDDRVDPRALKGLMVKSGFSKNLLIEQCEEEGLVEIKDGVKYLKGYEEKSLDELIIISKILYHKSLEIKGL